MDIRIRRILSITAAAAVLLLVSGRHDPVRLFIVICAAAFVSLCGLCKLWDNW